MRLLRQRVSVRQISVVAILLLIVSTSMAVAGLVWSSSLLRQTSVALVEAAEGLRLARDIEQALFSYQRLAVLADTPSLDMIQSAQSIVDGIGAARQVVRDDVQAELLDALLAQASVYFSQHAGNAQRDTNALETLQTVRPAFNRAMDTVLALARHSELELARGNSTAQRLGGLFEVTAMVAAGLALALVLLIGFTVRSMILQPILNIRDALVRFRGGDDGAQADEDIARELSEIAGAFNGMKAELARRREERLAFLGGVAHDLRNPLEALKAGVSALELGTVDPAVSQRTLRLIGRQLDHLERMCGDLLELSTMEAGKLELSAEAFDLRDAAEAVAELYRPVAGERRIDLELGRDVIVVMADRLRIEQAIGNLVKNAIKYSAEGTAITVGVSRRKDWAEVAVADRGVGIPEDEIDSIFRPFQFGSLTPTTGAGLGLSVVHRILAAHGGSIQVQSKVGVGSTFRLRVPLSSHSEDGAVAGAQPVAP